MKWIALIGSLALTGCDHKPMPPKEVAAKVAECKSLGLKPATYVYMWDNSIARIQCEPFN